MVKYRVTKMQDPGKIMYTMIIAPGVPGSNPDFVKNAPSIVILLLH